jgi:multidrug transporter EmrE-like cation transporter
MKMSKKFFISLLVLFLSILVVCSSLWAAEKEIKIGVIYPLSGALATLEGTYKGLQNLQQQNSSTIRILPSIS